MFREAMCIIENVSYSEEHETGENFHDRPSHNAAGEGRKQYSRCSGSVLEPNGLLSVILKPECQPLRPKDIGITTAEGAG